MKDTPIPLMPNLIAKLLSGGALWRADSRQVPGAPVKRVESWLSLRWARVSRTRR
jgi:hypothetical protein